jgi:hypothetical protein
MGIVSAVIAVLKVLEFILPVAVSLLGMIG